MDEKFYPAKLDENYYTCMANEIVLGKQRTTLRQAKFLRLMFSQIGTYDKELKTYSVAITELAQFLEIDSSNLYKDTFEFCREMRRNEIIIQTENKKNEWKVFGWIDVAEYDGKGMLHFKISQGLEPYFLDLKKHYTQYQLKEILQLQSFYAIRLYEFLKCKDGIQNGEKESLEFSIKDLRDFFETGKKYKQTRDFLKRTVYTATDEINGLTNLLVQAETIQKRAKGAPIIGVKFTLQWFGSLAEKQAYQKWEKENADRISTAVEYLSQLVEEELPGQIKF